MGWATWREGNVAVASATLKPACVGRDFGEWGIKMSTLPPLNIGNDDKKAAVANYYKNHFPYTAVHRWASRAWVADGPDAHKREWGWEGIDGTPFVRWKSCQTADDLHKLVSGTGVGKLNIGAMFSTDPANRHKTRDPMVPTRREFVIDIDLDDYGGISKNDLAACDRNWPLVAIGLEVCRRALIEHFGFHHILSVYSGRRGGHLWVCDERACLLSDDARASIAGWLLPREDKGKKLWRYLIEHPNFKEISANLVVPYFRSVCIQPIESGGLGKFEMPFQRKVFLESIDDTVRKALESQVCATDSPDAALNRIEAYCRGGRSGFLWQKYENAIWEMIGPCIDAAVSKHANHTLKAPYSVHPGTGRVSVPVFHAQLYKFSAATHAPLVADLMGPLLLRFGIAVDKLAKSVESFNQFVDTLAASETEKWKPPPPGPGLKRQRIVVHDMTKPPSDPTYTEEPVLANYPRPAWRLRRFWSVKANVDDPKKVVLSYWISEQRGDFDRVVIQPGQFPPFKHERQIDVDSVADAIVDTAHHASKEPGKSFHASDHAFIMVLNYGDDDFSPQMHRRLDRLSARIGENNDVCELNLAWGPDALSSYTRQQIAPLVGQLTCLHSPITLPIRRPGPTSL